jgi:hypothetical protein
MRKTTATWLAILLVVGTLAACADATAPTHKDCGGGSQDWTVCMAR